MVLGFKEQFKEPIINGQKIHSIRENKSHRWKLGMMIQFATGGRTKKYNQFHTGQCVSIQPIEIRWKKGFFCPFIKIGDKFLNYEEIFVLATNDGFDHISSFCQWFNKDFNGTIIHWTDFRY